MRRDIQSLVVKSLRAGSKTSLTLAAELDLPAAELRKCLWQANRSGIVEKDGKQPREPGGTGARPFLWKLVDQKQAAIQKARALLEANGFQVSAP